MFVFPLWTQWRGFQIHALAECGSQPGVLDHNERKQTYKQDYLKL